MYVSKVAQKQINHAPQIPPSTYVSRGVRGNSQSHSNTYNFSNTNNISSNSNPSHRNDAGLGSIITNVDERYYWEKPELIIHHIFWMSFCDVLIAIWGLIVWIPQIFDPSHSNENNLHYIIVDNNKACYVFGILAQLAGTGTIVWYIMVSWRIFVILFNVPLNCEQSNSIAKTNRIHSIIAWSIVIIATVIPMVDNAYGRLIDSNYDQECWIHKPIYQLCILIPITVAILFALFLLIAVYIRYSDSGNNNYNNNNHNNNNNTVYFTNYNSGGNGCCCGLCEKARKSSFDGLSTADEQIVKRLTLFSVVFIVSWVGVVVSRTYELVTGNISPYWLVLIHHVCVNGIGMGNAYVWSSSKNFQTISTGWKQIKNVSGNNKQNDDRVDARYLRLDL